MFLLESNVTSTFGLPSLATLVCRLIDTGSQHRLCRSGRTWGQQYCPSMVPCEGEKTWSIFRTPCNPEQMPLVGCDQQIRSRALEIVTQI